jgi:zinc transport system substrate-binding protein
MRPTRASLGLLVLLLIWTGSGLLSWPAAVPEAASRLQVAATIFPLYDLVRQVAEPEADVVRLLPPGVSPHTFTARPSTVRTLAGSAAVFAIGHGLDDWAARLAQGAGVSRTIVVDDGIPLRAWSHPAHARGHATAAEAVDPHYWLAVPNAMHMVQTIVAALGKLDPATAEAYQQRATTYIQRLRSVDQDIRRQLSGLPRRAIATFHPSFGYFAAAYGLEIAATFEPAPGKEPAPRDVERFLQQVKQHNLTVLFTEPQLPQASLTTLARDLGVALKELDPLGGTAGRDSYIALMRFNASQIATALQE